MQTRKPNWTHVLFWADRAPRLTVQLSGVLCSNLSSNAQNLGERERKSKQKIAISITTSASIQIFVVREKLHTHTLWTVPFTFGLTSTDGAHKQLCMELPSNHKQLI